MGITTTLQMKESKMSVCSAQLVALYANSWDMIPDHIIKDYVFNVTRAMP